MIVSCWDLHLLIKKMDKQEGLLDGDYVRSLLVIVLGVIIGISVGKPDSEKVGC